MSASKQKGTAWESAIVRFLAGVGFPHAERRTLAGIKDRGDIAGIPGIVIEAKNEKAQNLASWCDEAEIERRNDNAAIGAVWAHRRGKASPADGYVVLPGWAFVQLLTAAGYGNLEPESETENAA